MRKIAILTVGVLFIFSLLASGAAEAQKKKEKKDRGKRIKEMELVISDVGAATISYQYRYLSHRTLREEEVKENSAV